MVAAIAKPVGRSAVLRDHPGDDAQAQSDQPATVPMIGHPADDEREDRQYQGEMAKPARPWLGRLAAGYPAVG